MPPIHNTPPPMTAAMRAPFLAYAEYGTNVSAWLGKPERSLDESDDALRARLRAAAPEPSAKPNPYTEPAAWDRVSIGGTSYPAADVRAVREAVTEWRGETRVTEGVRVPVMRFTFDACSVGDMKDLEKMWADLAGFPLRPALPTPAGIAALRAFGDVLAAVAPHAARRAIADAIREDARRFPAFARARFRTVMWMLEGTRNRGPESAQIILSMCHRHEALPHDERVRAARGYGENDAVLFYERARGLP